MAGRLPFDFTLTSGKATKLSRQVKPAALVGRSDFVLIGANFAFPLWENSQLKLTVQI